jgi:hypothetical protein
MDRHALAILIPVIGVFFTGLIAFSFTRLGRALASRLEGRLDSSAEARFAALEAANEELERALAEANERLDFTERALTRQSVERIITPI